LIYWKNPQGKTILCGDERQAVKLSNEALQKGTDPLTETF